MLLIIFLLILYALTGVLYLANSNRENNKLNIFLHAGLGIVSGLGISSCLFFIFLVAGLPFYLQPFLEILINAFFIFLGSWKNNFSFLNSDVLQNAGNSKEKKSTLPINLFLFLFSVVIMYCFVVQLYQPNGGWDAFAIWNTQARMLYRGGEYWTNLFNDHFSHSDYPLMLAGLIVRWWFMAGDETVYIPIFIAILQVALISLLLFCTLSHHKSTLHGMLAVLILTSTPFFVKHGSSQYADTLLSLFFLSSCIFLFLADKFEKSRKKYLVMAGLTAGFAAWTKNEGALFLTAMIASQFLFLRDLKNFAERVTWLVIGAAPVLMIVIYFKLNLAPANDLVSGNQSAVIVERLAEPGRYYYILMWFAYTFLSLGKGIVSPFILLIIYALIAGKDREYREKSYRQIMATSLMVACGYFMVYVLTPHDLKWHLSTSLDRLMLQLLPTIVFGSFLYLKTPDRFLKTQF